MTINFKKISCISIFIVVFYKVFIKLRCIFNLLKTINFWDITRPYILFTSKFFVFIIIFHVFVLLLAFAYQWITWHVLPLVTFPTISGISMSVDTSNFTVVILTLLAMLILVQKENEEDQIHIFQDAYFGSSQIHQLTIMYRFEHANHHIQLIFFSKSLICISNIFHV